MAVEERPGRNDKDEDGGGPYEGDVDGKLDVLEEVPDQEGYGLGNEKRSLADEPVRE